MGNSTLLWLLLLPLTLGFANFFVTPKITKGQPVSFLICTSLAIMVIGSAIISTGYYLGKGSKTSDTEFWNGQITGKNRIHDSYTRSYSCNCVETCSGTGNNRSCSQTCQTCYEDHYTVKWEAYSNVGDFNIKTLDETSKRVYQSPDPAIYTRIKIGEACATKHGYTNYIKAVPESLFNPAQADIKKKFAKMIPDYPDFVYNLWKVDRVLSVGVNVADIHDWSAKLSDALKQMGPQKQANAIVVLVNTADPNYMYALRDAWQGGKKNDIIVGIGVTKLPQKADWVRVLALTDNEMFKVKLRDDIAALDVLTADSVVDAIKTNTLTLFKRKPMKDFAYLDAEIEPPEWVNWTSCIITLLTSVGFWFFINQNSQFTYKSKSRYNSYRRF